MVALTGKKPKDTFKDLLQISNNNSGIDATARNVEDGEGTTAPLKLSSTVVDINSGFQIGGVAITTTAAELNDLTGVSSAADGSFLVATGSGLAIEAAATALISLGINATAAEINDLVGVSSAADGAILVGTGSGMTLESGATARTSLGLAIGTNVQAWDTQLDDIAALAVTDGNFIVGNGSNWVAESGATARTSLGAAALAANTFTGVQQIPSGSAAAPSLTFSADTDVGIYRVGAEQIGFAARGLLIMNFTTVATAVNSWKFIGSAAGGVNQLQPIGGDVDVECSLTDTAGNSPFKWQNSKLSFFNGTNAVKQTVSGSRGGNAALASLLTALATYGLITDSSSA